MTTFSQSLKAVGQAAVAAAPALMALGSASRIGTLASPALPRLMDGSPALVLVSVSGQEQLSALAGFNTGFNTGINTGINSASTGVDGDFDYELVVATPDSPLLRSTEAAAGISVSPMIGQALSVVIETEGGLVPSTREINGLVTQASFVGAGDRRAVFKLRLQPWTHLMTLNAKRRIFHNQTVVQIAEAVLASYPYPVDNRLDIPPQDEQAEQGGEGGAGSNNSPYPTLTHTAQFNETDAVFLARLFSQHGIYSFIESSAGAHRLVLCDATVAHKPMPSPAYGTLAYYPKGYKIDEEHFNEFGVERHLTVTQTQTNTYDFIKPRADLQVLAQLPPEHLPASSQDGDAPQHVWDAFHNGSVQAHEQTGHSGPDTSDIAHAQHLTQIRLEAASCMALTATASGNVRGVSVGSVFQLRNHPLDSGVGQVLDRQAPASDAASDANIVWMIAKQRFVLVDVEQSTVLTQLLPHSSQQHVPPFVKGGTGGILGVAQTSNVATTQTSGYYCNSTLTLIPANIQYRAQPPLDPQTGLPVAQPRVYGVHQATVTTPPGKDQWLDEYGRCRVSFPWDAGTTRAEDPAPSDGPGPSDSSGSGSDNVSDENKSAWIRVSQGWAGGQLGTVSWPRVGQEVWVAYVHGDVDAPLIIGSASNPLNMPSWEMPSQQALTGMRSRELGDGAGNSPHGRSNHLILDDTQGKIQAQLKSDHAHSMLSLGHITRIEDNTGRKDYRGEGFELRSDAHGAIRAADGLLITTQSRPSGGQHVLDSGETQQRLQQAQSQQHSHAELAQQHQAQTAEDQQETAAQLEAQHGQVVGVGNTPSPSMGGTHHVTGRGGGAERGASPQSFPELTAPHLILSSAAGIASTTPESTHIASGEHTAITSGLHTTVSSGKSLLVTAMQSIRMLAYKAGVKLIAASGKVEIQAQTDNVEIIAQKIAKMIAHGEVQITGKLGVIINGGGSYMKLSVGSIEQGTSGTHVVHAASKSWVSEQDYPQMFQGPQMCDASMAQASQNGTPLVGIG